jgi:hypothetical protein
VLNNNKKGGACINITVRHVCVTIVGAEEKEVLTYSECVSVALVIQHVKCMRHIILSSVGCLAAPYFFALSRKWHDFKKEVPMIRVRF